MSVPFYKSREELNKYQNQYYHEKVKNNTKYYCNICNTNCYNKTNYTNHLKTKKHLKNSENYKKPEIVESPYKSQILQMMDNYSFYNIENGEPNRTNC